VSDNEPDRPEDMKVALWYVTREVKQGPKLCVEGDRISGVITPIAVKGPLLGEFQTEYPPQKVTEIMAGGKRTMRGVCENPVGRSSQEVTIQGYSLG